MAELQPADLAVADDDEVRIARRAVGAQRPAVTLHQLPPGQFEDLDEDRLGQPGQVVADLHQRQRAGDLRGRHPQPVGQLEVTKGLHLLLEVVLGNPHQPFAQLGGQLGGLWRTEQAPSLSSSSSRIGNRAICSATIGLAAQRVSRRSSAPGFSVSNTR